MSPQNGEELMPSTQQSTLGELETAVKSGLATARKSLTDPELLKLCDDLEFTWQHLCGQLIIVTVGLAAMNYRSEEQIENQLRDYLESINAGKRLIDTPAHNEMAI